MECEVNLISTIIVENVCLDLKNLNIHFLTTTLGGAVAAPPGKILRPSAAFSRYPQKSVEVGRHAQNQAYLHWSLSIRHALHLQFPGDRLCHRLRLIGTSAIDEIKSFHDFRPISMLSGSKWSRAWYGKVVRCMWLRIQGVPAQTKPWRHQTCTFSWLMVTFRSIDAPLKYPSKR